MSLTFKYSLMERPPPFGSVRLPTIPVKLYGRNEIPLDVVALIDSGADITFIPKALGELLELDLESNKTEVKGIGGPIPAIHERIVIKIGNEHETYKLKIPVIVPLIDSQTVPAILLGRAGIFDHFDIIFKEREEKTIFKKISKA